MRKNTDYITSIRFGEREAELIKAIAAKKQWSVNHAVREAIYIAYGDEMKEDRNAAAA
jgi:hypothetical protein